MKFLITENKLEEMVFKFLDSKNYKTIKVRDKEVKNFKTSYLYFIQNPESGYADIVYHYWKGKLYITTELCDEIISLFSMDEDDNHCDLIITEWVESKINKEIDVWNIFVWSVDSVLGDGIFNLNES